MMLKSEGEKSGNQSISSISNRLNATIRRNERIKPCCAPLIFTHEL